MIKSVLIIVLISISVVANAYDEERSASNLASDLSECVAYYTLIAMQMEKQNTDATKLIKSSEIAYEMAKSISTEETVKARVQLYANDMLEKINHNWSNGAILINKYGEHCKKIITAPDKRLQYWLDKK